MVFNKQLLTECKRILKIGLPITIAQLLNMSMGFVDTVMTGNYSAEALAAVSGSHHIIIPFLLFGAAVVGAGQAITAHHFGAGLEKMEIGKVTLHAVIVGTLYSILMILFTKVAPNLFPFFGFDQQVILLATDYLFAFSWGLPATLMFIAFAGFFAGISKPAMTMLVSFLMLCVNITGNYALIFGHFGFPAMGAEGAGWTSSIAAWSGVLGIILITVLHKEIKAFNPFKSLFKLQRSLFHQILKIGLPSGFSNAFEASMFAVFSLLMGRFGVHVLAGSQIALNCSAIAFMIPLGFSFAITTNVSQYLGQNRFSDAKVVGYAGYIINGLFNIISALVLILFSHEIASFYTNDLRLVEIASTLLIFGGIFQFSDGSQVAGMGILRGYKDTKIPMFSNLFSYWGVGMTLGYFLGFVLDYQAKGMWIGIIIGLSVASFLHWLRFEIVSSKFIKTGASS